MRSSRGGWVSNSLFSRESLPSAFSRGNGDSIHRCAVARLCVDTTVWSSRSFSSAEISPGG